MRRSLEWNLLTLVSHQNLAPGNMSMDLYRPLLHTSQPQTSSIKFAEPDSFHRWESMNDQTLYHSKLDDHAFSIIELEATALVICVKAVGT